jgi:hypothetical protein
MILNSKLFKVKLLNLNVQLCRYSVRKKIMAQYLY